MNVAAVAILQELHLEEVEIGSVAVAAVGIETHHHLLPWGEERHKSFRY
jgi:hypothetical protein